MGQGPRAVLAEALGLMVVGKSRKTAAGRRPQCTGLALISKLGIEKLLLGKKKSLQSDCVEIVLNGPQRSLCFMVSEVKLLLAFYCIQLPDTESTVHTVCPVFSVFNAFFLFL